jgi:transcriptional regulator with XRE-family HTH domain
MKELRKEHKLTQADAAKILGVSTNHYGKYERGETNILLEHVMKLCTYYKVSLDYFIGWSNYRSEDDAFKERLVAKLMKFQH